MMKIKFEAYKVIIGFFLSGLVLISLGFYFTAQFKKDENLRGVLAQVSRESGNVYIYRHTSSGNSASTYSANDKITVDKKDFLHSFDILETSEIGEALVRFNNGFQVKIIPQSLVLFEKLETTDNLSDIVNLVIQRGDLSVEKMGGQEEGLSISKNGQKISAKQYNSSPLARIQTEDSSKSSIPLIKNKELNSKYDLAESLTEEEISHIMSQQKNYFFKCYTQLLEKEPQSVGESSISFTIENNGKITHIDVNSANIKNESFKKCIIEVTKRVNFRSFSGRAISTVFLLKFQ